MTSNVDASLSEQASLVPGLGKEKPGTVGVISTTSQKDGGEDNRFIFRVPYAQMIEASQLGFPCLRLYLAICYQFGLQRRRGSVQITRARREEMGLDNRAYLRALEKLEQHNIIEVERDGKYPAKIKLNMS